MNLLRRIDQILLFLEKFVLRVSIISASVMLITNVIGRKVFNHSLTFSEEVGGFFILATTFIGIGYGARIGRHIRMSAVFDLLPSRFQKITIIIINGFTSIILFLLTYYAYGYFLKVKKLGIVTPALQYPRYIFIAFVVAGFFIGGVEYLKNTIINFKDDQVYISTHKKQVEA